jgi:hypothetical protein
MSTSPQPSREKPTVTAITAEERRELDQRVRDKHQRLRNRYPEIYGKVVDWIHHYIEDGTLYVCIRFQDKTDFALEFSPQIVRVGTELCDSATDDFDVIRNYYRHFRTAPCENFGGVLTLAALRRKEPPGANALQRAAHPLNLPSHCNGFHGFSPCALALFGRQSA